MHYKLSYRNLGNGIPAKVNIDKSGANTAAIAAFNQEAGTDIEIRQCKYLNNVVEQDHRFVKQKMVAAAVTGGFQTFYTAKATLCGLDDSWRGPRSGAVLRLRTGSQKPSQLVHRIRKAQVRPLWGGSDAEQFAALAA